MRLLPRPSAVAFDLDGTLVDSRLDIAAACNHVLASAGRPTLDPRVIGTFVGDGSRTLLARAFGWDRLDPRLDALAEAFIAYYAEHPVEQTTWMPGALDLLDTLAPTPLAIVTNKARVVAVRVLDRLGAGGRFAVLVAGGDGPLKPDPAPVTAVATALGITPASLWVVGDGDQDVLAARAAGAVAVAVRGGFLSDERLHAASPDAVVDSLADVLTLIQRAAS
jgi:phosphoglycolate phosphatase